VNPEKTFAVKRDHALEQFFEQAGLLIPDGIGVVLAARLLHGVRLSRLAGADLMERLCQHAAGSGYRLFVYGAAEEVNRAAVAELERRYPALQIVGRSHGYIPDDQTEGLVDQINASGADILFVGLGSPRQEHWMRQYGPRVACKVCLGVGGSLDTVVGKVKRAPRLFRRLGLEWLYRLGRQPSRVRRQMVLPLFVGLVLRDKLFGTPCQTGRGNHR
jgi:N-acetylglucosaminyldiphosphoundecaprenol N-acetyl-beta-D-mannosaminyltransferase